MRSGWLLVALAPACGGAGATTPSNAALVEGQAPGAPQGGTAAAKVSASQIGADGTLTALIDAPVAVDASGRYSLPVTIAAGSTDQLLISAKSAAGTTLGTVVVEGDFAAKVSYKATPIDASSTAEANLLVNAKSSGQWGADFTLAEMRALMSDQTAASIGANQTDPTRASAATDATASITAWRSMLTAQSFSAADHATMLSSVMTAEATLDGQLDAASTATQKDAAASGYFSAFIKANSDAGATQAQLAAAATATADVMAVYAGAMDASDSADVLARAESLRASQVIAAVATDLQTLGATTASQSVVATAGTTLQTQIAAAAQSGSGAQGAINTAWTLYGTNVNAQLNSTLTVAASATTAVQAAITTDLATLTAAKASLSATATISVTADAESQALLTFMTNAQAHTTLLTSVGVSDANAAAYLNAALLIQAAGGA